MPPAPPRALVYVVDGTLSTLAPGRETNAGLLYKLLREQKAGTGLRVDYHPGVQGRGAAKWFRAATGLGLNDAIRDGYAQLSSRWRPGDRIYLFGYSRGAYAVRSLAGMIDRVGLLRRDLAVERRVDRAFRLYETGSPEARAAFSYRYCHPEVEIQMIGVWDTVRALGLPYPILSRLHPWATEFHDHALGDTVLNGFHALALDEDRTAFRPVMWEIARDWPGRAEQIWFAGAHGDVGGEIGRKHKARPLSNIPLVWMLERAENCGLPLPEGWRERFPTDPLAPALGARRGIAKFFVLRGPRRVGAWDSEDLHPSVAERMERLRYVPKALGLGAD